MRTNTTGAGDKQNVKDRELTQVQIYKLFTFVQKKYDYFTNFIIFIKSLEGARGQKVPKLLSVSRTYAREARAHAHGLQTILCTSPLAPSKPPNHPMVCSAQIFISSIYGRDGKPSLTCQRTTSATMAPYRGANRYLRCLFIKFEAKEKARSQGPGSKKRKTGLVILYTASTRHLKT